MTLIKLKPTLRHSSQTSELNKWFNSISYNIPPVVTGDSEWKPRFEILDTEKSYRLRGELPGLSKKDVNINVSENIITISGERKNSMISKDEKYSDIYHGNFSSKFNLPEDTNEDTIKASMKNGVLAIEIPRNEKVLPKSKKIVIK